MSHKPTHEQAEFVGAFAAGDSLVVNAVAGSGKTTSLKMAANAVPKRRCLYVAYNRALADDARSAFPASVECRTAHSLAFTAVGKRYIGRIKNSGRVPAWQAAKILYGDGNVADTRVLRHPVEILGTKFRPAALTRIALDTVQRWCESADAEIGIHHVPRIEGVSGPARGQLAELVLPIARRAWVDLTDTAGKLRFNPDHYLKMWALTEPRLPTESILFDEAQDANPVLASLLIAQKHTQLVAVGDPCQQLYAWRGSVDALATWPAEQRLTLSQSFRFGQTIADRANKWLGLLKSPTRVIGAPWIDSRVRHVDQPDAVLCRTNAGAMKQTMERLATGTKVYLAGGGNQIKTLAEAADKLIHGEPCDHPELVAFSSWDEVCSYVKEESDGGDLAPAVKLINDYGSDKIIATVKGLASRADDADVVISTGHKSKGLQWPRVVIAGDYHEPQPTAYPGPKSMQKALVLRKPDLMLAYVAVTRAEHVLDDAGLAWVDRIHDHDVPIVLAGDDR